MFVIIPSVRVILEIKIVGIINQVAYLLNFLFGSGKLSKNKKIKKKTKGPRIKSSFKNIVANQGSINQFSKKLLAHQIARTIEKIKNKRLVKDSLFFTKAEYPKVAMETEIDEAMMTKNINIIEN